MASFTLSLAVSYSMIYTHHVYYQVLNQTLKCKCLIKGKEVSSK